MRWLFSDPNNAHECRQRQQVLQRMDHWWRSFARQQATIADSFCQPHCTFDVSRWMQEHLQAIDDRIQQLATFRDHLAGEIKKWDGEREPTCRGLCQIIVNAEDRASTGRPVELHIGSRRTERSNSQTRRR